MGTRASLGAHFLIIITGILSAPHAFCASRLEMLAEIMAGAICITLRISVLSKKLGSNNPDESREEFKVCLRAKHSILSAEDVNTSN